jgi:hypothetical protein
MNIETFRQFANGMKEALDNLENFLKETEYNQEEHPFRKVVSQDQWETQKITLWDRLKHKVKTILKWK